MASSLSLRFRPPKARLPESLPGRTARCGLPNGAATRSGGSPSPASSPSLSYRPPIRATTARQLGSLPGPDGALWFTEQSGNKIGRITTAGVITEFALASVDSQPYAIVAGPDNALWFTESGSNKIGRVTTAGFITEFEIPTAQSFPMGIAAGPDGALWFAENGTGSNKIGRITTAGVITEFALPTAYGAPDGIVTGPDGAVWFTEFSRNRIGRITTAGVITEFATPTRASLPASITAGPDGALWFTESHGNNIGRITTTTSAIFPTVTAIRASLDTSILGRSVTFTATIDGNGPAGTVQFMDGPSKLGPAVTLTGGVATFTTATLGVGMHPITAMYSGDANNNSSTSPGWSQVVNEVPPVAVFHRPPARAAPRPVQPLLPSP